MVHMQIRELAVARSKEKFAAMVVENMPLSEAEGKKMDEAIKNAKVNRSAGIWQPRTRRN